MWYRSNAWGVRGMTTYPDWALDTFLARVAPVLSQAITDELARHWIDTCWPASGERTRFRLFPGSLYLLWVEALGGAPSDEHDRIAAAIECLHNASLHHDDALDGHDSRRGVETLRGAGGTSAAILAGDGLIGIGFSLASSVRLRDCARVLHRLGDAWARMTLGQAMDEAASWRRVPFSDRTRHWESMARLKLSIGNVAGPVAATTCGREADSPAIGALHEDFSLVSQVMNDLGDLSGWAGFHDIALCSREPRSEARLKPSIATLWQQEEDASCMSADEALMRRAMRDIAARTERAVQCLSSMLLLRAAQDVLEDFFTRPLHELSQAVERGLTG